MSLSNCKTQSSCPKISHYTNEESKMMTINNWRKTLCISKSAVVSYLKFILTLLSPIIKKYLFCLNFFIFYFNLLAQCDKKLRPNVLLLFWRFWGLISANLDQSLHKKWSFLLSIFFSKCDQIRWKLQQNPQVIYTSFFVQQIPQNCKMV